MIVVSVLEQLYPYFCRTANELSNDNDWGHRYLSYIYGKGSPVQVLQPQKIIALREQRGWDKKRLAEEAHLSPSVITRIEKGQQKDFKLSAVVAIAHALDVPVDSLLAEPHHSPSSEFISELQAALAVLAQQPRQAQLHVAGMIRGYLTTRSEE